MVTYTKACPVKDKENIVVEWISYIVGDNGLLTGQALYGPTPELAELSARKFAQLKNEKEKE